MYEAFKTGPLGDDKVQIHMQTCGKRPILRTAGAEALPAFRNKFCDSLFMIALALGRRGRHNGDFNMD